MKVRYIGESFGVAGLRNKRVYECLGVEYGLLRIVDNDEDPALYSAINPGPLDGSSSGGIWEIVEDDEQGTLRKAIYRE